MCVEAGQTTGPGLLSGSVILDRPETLPDHRATVGRVTSAVSTEDAVIDAVRDYIEPNGMRSAVR
jgi:hypothetical protein